MKSRSFIHSLNDAVEGFIYVVKNERNMRIHFLGAFFILILAIAMGISRVEWIVLCSVVTLVLVAEMMNTAVEETVDLAKSSFNPTARIIKHISAGMVLVSALNALIVIFFIFSRHFDRPLAFLNGKLHYTSWHLTFVTLLVIVFIVIAGKAFSKSGTPFRGGIISGHAAVAFSLWTIVFLYSTDDFVKGIALVLALMVAQSRLRAKIHSFWEVIAGAIVGFLATSLFFQIFR
jgi:diacylglycerol kinase (ATP)